MSIDTLREKTWTALKAAQPKKTGTMPAVDHVFQAVYLLSGVGLDTKAIAESLGVSLNYVRVAKRNNAKRLLPTVEIAAPKVKAKRETAAERNRLAAIPDWNIDALFALTERLREALDEDLANTCDAAMLRKMGREDLLACAGKTRQQSDPPAT